jgi:2-polyprenyl-3-methyl-5-hydroxy-6-metoxy-1,4-benzoquinol methylase
MDATEVLLYSLKVWGYKQGEMVSLLIHLGDRLGLYAAMDGVGPITSDELAERTGLHERWVREWLRGNAAAELLETTDGTTFELTPVGAMVLARENESTAFAAGAFSGPTDPRVIDGLADAFSTGVGLSYDQLGPSGAHRTERMLGPWARLALVPLIVPALDGVGAKLEAGILVADVGCGAGVALTALAAAYPKSTFHGYELSTHALDRAHQRVADAGLTNVELFHRRAEELPQDGQYGFVLTFDCLHDMTRPADAIAAIRGAIADDGTWLIKDIRSTGTWQGDHKNPMHAMMYGFSVASCMSSALSEPGGAGLGTLGFTPVLAEQMVRDAGFGSFTTHDFDDPANLYYEVRV